MAKNDSPFRAALLRMSATVDELLEMERMRDASASALSYRVDTLSKSLADPFKHQIELTLSNARIAIQNDGDRVALAAVAKASHAAGLLDDDALARVLHDFGIQ